jgi:hypothetical protein
LQAIPANNIYASSNGALSGNGQQINLATLLRARAQLLRQNVQPQDIMYFVDPIQEAQLMVIPQFISSDFISNKPIVNGQVGTLLGLTPGLLYVGTPINDFEVYVIAVLFKTFGLWNCSQHRFFAHVFGASVVVV